MKILCDLADLNLQNRLNKNNVEFVITGDLLAGQANCRMDVLMDVLINCWSSNPLSTATRSPTRRWPWGYSAG